MSGFRHMDFLHSQACPGAIKSEVQHLDSYKVLPWKDNINSYSLKSG